MHKNFKDAKTAIQKSFKFELLGYTYLGIFFLTLTFIFIGILFVKSDFIAFFIALALISLAISTQLFKLRSESLEDRKKALHKLEIDFWKIEHPDDIYINQLDNDEFSLEPSKFEKNILELKMEVAKKHKILNDTYIPKIRICILMKIFSISAIIFALISFFSTFYMRDVISYVLNFSGMVITILVGIILFKFFNKQKKKLEFSLKYEKDYIDEEIAKAEFEKEFHNK